MIVRPTVLLLGLLGLPAMVSLGCREAPAAAKSQAPPPAPVEVALTEAGVLTEDWVFAGEVRSLRAATLAPGAGGEVIMIEVREGDRVELGQVLVELDERAAKARLRAAKSSQRESDRELAQARRDADRAKSLGGSVLAEAEIERDTTRADTLEARKRRFGAEVEASRAELDDHRILAPFPGVIARRLVDLGQWVDSGETVLELISVDEVELLVEVRPELVGHLRVGGMASVSPSTAISDRLADRVDAEIRGVVPSLDPRTRTVKVRLAPTQARAWLLPGAAIDVAFPVTIDTATVRVSEAQSGGVVIVPRDALVLGAVDIRVLVVEDDAATPIQVEVLARAGDRAVIRGPGLVPGAKVVTRGNERLRPGQAVRVITPTPEPSARPNPEPSK